MKYTEEPLTGETPSLGLVNVGPVEGIDFVSIEKATGARVSLEAQQSWLLMLQGGKYEPLLTVSERRV